MSVLQRALSYGIPMQRATGPEQVQLVQQNVQLNVHPTPSDHAQVIEERANLHLAAAQHINEQISKTLFNNIQPLYNKEQKNSRGWKA